MHAAGRRPGARGSRPPAGRPTRARRRTASCPSPRRRGSARRKRTSSAGGRAGDPVRSAVPTSSPRRRRPRARLPGRSGRAVPAGSYRLDPARGHARPAPRAPQRAAGRLDQADHPRAVRTVGLEQLEHPGVIAAALARERPGRPGSGGGSRRRSRRRRRPSARTATSAAVHGPMPGQRRQPGVGLVERQVDGRLEPGGPRRDPSDDARPGAARRRTGGSRSRGARRAGGRRRRAAGRTSPGRAPARRSARTRPRNARRASSPVTFCSRIAGTSDSRTAPRPRDPHAPEAASELGDTDAAAAKPVPVVVEPDQPGHGGEGTVGARAPGLGATRSSPWTRSRRVAGPSAVRVARQQRRSARRIVGSP